jgi:tRNA-dihydrouridine synthase C
MVSTASPLAMTPGRIVLAPMEGVADALLRDVLTRLARYDWSVTEFVRVTGTVLPSRVYSRTCPELLTNGRTSVGTPVRVQLLGSDPEMLALNAARLAKLEPFGIDLNFGCPAPSVNRHRGGAALLGEPELLQAIVAAVRAAVPPELPVSAKMRLGIESPERALDCALALQAGGASEIVVHGRTKADGYRPPARWEWISRIREALTIPVIANGEVWNVHDFRQIRLETGCRDVMVGRGAVADPFLVGRIRGERDEEPGPADWQDLRPLLAVFWAHVLRTVRAQHAPGRLKMWLHLLRRTYPEARVLFDALRAVITPEAVEVVFAEAGIETAVRSAA